MPADPITVLGDNSQSGCYLLRMRITQPITVSFGRFNQGRPLALAPGASVYVGSAMQGLAPRLIRHATRSGNRAPHPIRQSMLAHFPKINLGKARLRPLADKKLHWHIDHLLDQEAVQLAHVLIIRSELPLEIPLASFLEQEPTTSILMKGLGASDIPGSTHLLHVNANDAWWQQLPTRIMAHLRCG